MNRATILEGLKLALLIALLVLAYQLFLMAAQAGIIPHR